MSLDRIFFEDPCQTICAADYSPLSFYYGLNGSCPNLDIKPVSTDSERGLVYLVQEQLRM
ncbi:hypothetical protein A0J61_02132 [Choanephora cucurbitarum]|uniref:Uncharacterized protein n=1 Tax=Choanephora cucurbitarum TaxID=101091 RepID=A0A1C7NL23_9FUNG|nr:hypothetical protein A0J61_02132 [Choanephora cucurbitarum]